ncbi:MAG: AAA family ATPase [Leptospiraceae bacterium]|nr:AAA family ATPase [Leptospiraceae bacterium]
MKISNVTISSYRSITSAYKLPLSNYSVLIGPNNEGKSNILKSIVSALTILSQNKKDIKEKGRKATYSYSDLKDFNFNWKRDYPVIYQDSYPDGRSEFTLEFELNDVEKENFRSKIKININSDLKVKLSLGKDDVKIRILMKGPGSASFNKKINEIVEFISNNISIEYIPSIRTFELSLNIVEDLVASELKNLENDPIYLSLINQIVEIQKPALERLSSRLQETVKNFIPNISNIIINTENSLQHAIRNSSRVLIDDGNLTELKYKGDGIISLTAISLLKLLSDESKGQKSIILAIDEPESHLHSGAIHSLKKILQDISENNQIIITSHSAILTDRETVKNNILVEKGSASVVRNITQVREALGIILSENLIGADLILILEGDEDIELMKSWITKKSSKIANAINRNKLIIDVMGGASNLIYKSSFYRSNLCKIIAFLDDDDAGRTSVQKAKDANIIKENDYYLCKAKGRNKSEIEDLINPDIYSELILNEYGVNIQSNPIFKDTNLIWSDRIRLIFKSSGKLWDKKIEMDVKYKVNSSASAIGLDSLLSYNHEIIDSLILGIENKLDL